MTGILLRQWRDGVDGGPSGNTLAMAAGLLLLGLIGVWFRNGHRLWVAARAR
jgi:LPXTG-motif cell wall-anchored protein